MPHNEDPKLEKLEEELKAARKEFEEDYNPPDNSGKTDMSSSKVAYEFLAHVMVGGFLGYLLDKYLGIAPWGMIFMTIVGFASGVYRADRAMKKNR